MAYCASFKDGTLKLKRGYLDSSSSTVLFRDIPDAGGQVTVGLEKGGDVHDADVHAKHLGDQHLHFLLVDALVQVGYLQLHGTVGDDCGGTATTRRR